MGKKEITIKEIEEKGIMCLVDVVVLRNIMTGSDNWAIKAVLDLVNNAYDFRIFQEKYNDSKSLRANPCTAICFNEDFTPVNIKIASNILRNLKEINEYYPLINSFINSANTELVTTISFEFAQLKLEQYEIFQQKRKQA